MQIASVTLADMLRHGEQVEEGKPINWNTNTDTNTNTIVQIEIQYWLICVPSSE